MTFSKEATARLITWPAGIGKRTAVGEQLETEKVVATVLRFNYEKTVADNQLNTSGSLSGVADNLLKEFQKLTPQVKGEVPTNQFARLALESGDVVPLSQPDKQISGNFRLMQLAVTAKKVKVTLESVETGVVRVRSLSLSDVIEGILIRTQDQSIES